MSFIDDIVKIENPSELIGSIDTLLITMKKNSESFEFSKLNELKKFLIERKMTEQWIRIANQVQYLQKSHFEFSFELPMQYLEIGDIGNAKTVAENNLDFLHKKKRYSRYIEYFSKIKDQIELSSEFYAIHSYISILVLDDNEIENYILEQINSAKYTSEDLQRVIKTGSQQFEIPRKRKLLMEALISVLEIKEIKCSLKSLKKLLNNQFELLITFGPHNYLVQLLSLFLDNTGIVSFSLPSKNEKVKNILRKDFHLATEFYKKIHLKKIPVESSFDLGSELFGETENSAPSDESEQKKAEFNDYSAINGKITDENFDRLDKDFSSYIKKSTLGFEELKELAIAVITSELPIAAGAVIEKMRTEAANSDQRMIVDYLNAHCLYVFEKHDELETFVNLAVSVIPMTNDQRIGYLRLISLSKNRQGKYRESKSVEQLISKLLMVRVEE